jgi:L-ascorbate metabolism protein UlaG (beta-lactamase superfamily)
MIITHHGAEFIKIVFGDTTLAFNPPSKKSNIAAPRFGADIAFQTLAHEDMNGGAELARGDKEPFVISGPGEYEVGGVFSIGVPSVSHYDTADKKGSATASRINTVYALQFEGMNLLFAGALDEKKLDQSALEDIDSVDILFVPIGGEGVLDAAGALSLANSLEANVIIPIHYEDISGVNAKDTLKTFLKEAGQEDAEVMDKFTIKKKDLAGMKGKVVVLAKV